MFIVTTTETAKCSFAIHRRRRRTLNNCIRTWRKSSQSLAAKGRKQEDILVLSSLSPVLKSQKKKKVSESNKKDRMPAGGDFLREQTWKLKRKYMGWSTDGDGAV